MGTVSIPSQCRGCRAAVLARACALVVLLGVAPGPVRAQTLQGRVLDLDNDEPVPTALVRLLDESGEERAITAADGAGAYRIEVPGPGTYRLIAERIGYESFETPLLEVGRPDAVYPIDLLMRRAPIPIQGLDVTAERLEREIRLAIGISPASLRVPPLDYEAIRDHADRGRDVTGMVRWANAAGLVVMETREGPCYQARGRGCLPVYLNGFRLNPEIVSSVPLDMLYAAVILYPGESIGYEGGAVLLYTEAWLR